MTDKKVKETGHRTGISMGPSFVSVFRLLFGSLALAVSAGCTYVQLDPPVAKFRFVTPDTMVQVPPTQVPLKSGTVTLADGWPLWYQDTGGSGEPVILLHAGTGSALVWEYQLPVLARAGYRVIAYSRRGYYGSEKSQADSQPTTARSEAERASASGGPDSSTTRPRLQPASQDLHELITSLSLGRVHLVATAAGGSVALDYAVSHPDNVISLVVANSLAGISDSASSATTRALLPKGFSEMPAEFREVGPAYRTYNAEGVKRWVALHEKAGKSVSQPMANKLSWNTMSTIKTPVLLITGDADLYMPPPRMRELSAHLENSELVVIGEAGHSAYWEQPAIFNRELLQFLERYH